MVLICVNMVVPYICTTVLPPMGELRRVYAKAEHSNMTGGMKDRMAYHIIRSAINRVYDSCFDPSDPSTVPAGVYQLAKRIERRSSADRRV